MLTFKYVVKFGMNLGIFLDEQRENIAIFPCTYTWTNALQSYTYTENEDRISI